MIKERLKKMGEILVAQGLIDEEQFLRAMRECIKSGISFGATLVKLGYINRDELTDILGEQIQILQRKRIGEVLIEQGFITEKQLIAGLEEQKRSGLHLGKCLISLGFISEGKLIDVLSAQLDIQHVRLDNFSFSPSLLKVVHEEMAREYRVIPLFESGAVITVVMADPTNQRVIDHLKFKTGKEIEPVIASERSILVAIEKNYTPDLKQRDDIVYDTDNSSEQGFETVTVKTLGDEEDTQAIEMIKNIVSSAVTMEASAIHIEPMQQQCRLRFRIGNGLFEQDPVPLPMQRGIVSCLKSMAELNPEEKLKPQEGFIQFPYEGRPIDLQISTFPVMTGEGNVNEKTVLRIVNQGRNIPSFSQLGFLPNTFRLFDELIRLPDGIILVTGPKGSGKTTTLYTVLQYLNNYYSGKKNIMTVEGRIEQNLDGIIQSQVNPEAEFQFVSGIRSILQQDPDIIMVGEISDIETCRMMVMAALAGHFVFSALHTNDAASAYIRLFDMGIEPYLIASTVKGILSQRLVKRNCEHCREEYEPEPSLLQKAGLKPGINVFRGRGCRHCNNTGYHGEMGIFELLIPDMHMEDMLGRRPSYDDIKKYSLKKERYDTLWHDGLRKVLSGATSIEQVLGALLNE